MRFETWLISGLLIILTLSAFVGMYMYGVDTYGVDVPDEFRSLYDSYTVNDTTASMLASNYSNFIIDMSNESKNAKALETDYGTDVTKSQTNVLKRAWNVMSDSAQRFTGMMAYITKAQELLGIPVVIVVVIGGIITTMLLFAFLYMIFGRQA